MSRDRIGWGVGQELVHEADLEEVRRRCSEIGGHRMMPTENVLELQFEAPLLIGIERELTERHDRTAVRKPSCSRFGICVADRTATV